MRNFGLAPETAALIRFVIVESEWRTETKTRTEGKRRKKNQ